MPAKKFVEVLYKVTCIPLFWGVCRKPGNENLIRTTYVLPDGIKHKRGFVKDPEEAQRYLSLQEKGALPTDSQEKEREHEVSQNVVTIEDRKDDASVKNEVWILLNDLAMKRMFSCYRKFSSYCILIFLFNNTKFSSYMQELKLTNERFLVPEMLFHPADLGNFLLQKPNFYW